MDIESIASIIAGLFTGWFVAEFLFLIKAIRKQVEAKTESIKRGKL